MKIIYNNKTYNQIISFDEQNNVTEETFTFKPSPLNNFKSQSKKITTNFCPLKPSI